MRRLALSAVVLLGTAFGSLPGLSQATPALADEGQDMVSSSLGMMGSGPMDFWGPMPGWGLTPDWGTLPGFLGMPMGMGMMRDHGGMQGRLRGCGMGERNISAADAAERPRVTINMYDDYFLPSEVSVPPGTLVVWRNMGDDPHTTTSWDRWNSGVLRPGQSCAALFQTPGTYQYLSIVADDGGRMTGTLTVAGEPLTGRSNHPMTHEGGHMRRGPGMGPGMMPGMPGGMMPGMPGLGMPGMMPGGMSSRGSSSSSGSSSDAAPSTAPSNTPASPGSQSTPTNQPGASGQSGATSQGGGTTQPDSSPR